MQTFINNKKLKVARYDTKHEIKSKNAKNAFVIGSYVTVFHRIYRFTTQTWHSMHRMCYYVVRCWITWHHKYTQLYFKWDAMLEDDNSKYWKIRLMLWTSIINIWDIKYKEYITAIFRAIMFESLTKLNNTRTNKMHIPKVRTIIFSKILKCLCIDPHVSNNL